MGNNRRLDRFGRKHLDYKVFPERVNGKRVVMEIIDIVGNDKAKKDLRDHYGYRELSDIRQFKLPNKLIGILISYLCCHFHTEIEEYLGKEKYLDIIQEKALPFYERQSKVEHFRWVMVGDKRKLDLL